MLSIEAKRLEWALTEFLGQQWPLVAIVAGATMTVPVGGPVPVRYALPVEGKMLMRCASLAVIAAVILSSVSVHEAQAAGGIALPLFQSTSSPRQQIADVQVWDPYPLPYEMPARRIARVLATFSIRRRK